MDLEKAAYTMVPRVSDEDGAITVDLVPAFVGPPPAPGTPIPAEDLHAEGVTEQDRKAADAMGAKILGAAPPGKRGVEAEAATDDAEPDNGEEAL